MNDAIVDNKDSIVDIKKRIVDDLQNMDYILKRLAIRTRWQFSGWINLRY